MSQNQNQNLSQNQARFLCSQQVSLYSS